MQGGGLGLLHGFSYFFLFGSDQDELAWPAHFTVLEETPRSRFRAVQCYDDPTNG